MWNVYGMKLYVSCQFDIAFFCYCMGATTGGGGGPNLPKIWMDP